MNFIIAAVFLLIFLGILISGIVYLKRRLNRYIRDGSKIYRPILYTLGFIFITFGITSYIMIESTIWQFMYTWSSQLFGFFLYLILSLLLIDLVNKFYPLKSTLNGMISVSVAAFISFYGVWNATDLEVRTIQIPVKGLKNEIKAVHLTDIHIGLVRGEAHLQKIVDRTNQLDPDVVFHTGDLFDDASRLGIDVLMPLSEIQIPHYFVEGNHDIYAGITKVNDYLRQLGVIVLENEVALFDSLQIIGLRHMVGDDESFNMHATPGRNTIKQVLNSLEPDKNKPAIILHHGPDGFKYANEKGIDVMLAGHTHGGQLFPFNLFAELLFPVNTGLHQYQDLSVYVSEGAGTIGPPMRVGTDSEITLIHLVPAE